MKKLAVVCLVLLFLAGTLAGCGDTAGNETSTPEAADPANENPNTDDVTDDDGPADTPGEVKKIGVIQLAEHVALDAAYEGFVDGLAEAGYIDGENIIIDYNNAQGDIPNCTTIATKLVNDNNDLILAIATPAAQAVANATEDIPILVTAVTDPAEAKLVDSNEAPGGNVSGTSDLTPCAEQMDLLKEIFPEAETVGILYCSAEANSIIQADAAKARAEEIGLETVDFTVVDTNDLQTVVESMVTKVDVVYAPTDNLIATAMATVATICNNAGVPVVTGEQGMVEEGGLITYSISYYELGKLTAAQAVQILEGADPADMPIGYSQNFDVFANRTTMELLGITFPDGVNPTFVEDLEDEEAGEETGDEDADVDQDEDGDE